MKICALAASLLLACFGVADNPGRDDTAADPVDGKWSAVEEPSYEFLVSHSARQSSGKWDRVRNQQIPLNPSQNCSKIPFRIFKIELRLTYSETETSETLGLTKKGR